MCGFCGFTGNVMGREELLQHMADTITHRGPDSQGTYIDEYMGMAFRRLSIIDLEGGSQPIENEDGSKVLMFNGEIYNYRALREELTAAGHCFKTASDSEVLLHGYEEWGADLLPRLRGMFAFVVWDKADQSLFLARDYFGIKPMHYTLLPDGRFIFASEIKCILQHPDYQKGFNEAALDSYLSYQYSLPRETFFKNIYCLQPAHYLRWQNGKVTETRYWEATFSPDESMTMEQAVNEIDNVFTDSVEAHRISDVEVGCFLSGGVDSCFVASYFGGQKAFTVGFDNGQHYNETNFAEELAAAVGIEHHKHIISQEEYWSVLPEVQYMLDQPLADPACVALYFVSKLAAEKVKVVLSGEGADELFGGYRIYHEPTSLAAYQRLPRLLRKALAALVSAVPFSFKGKSFVLRGAKTLEERFIGNAYMFSRSEKARLLKTIPATDPALHTKPWYERCRGLDDVTRMQYLDIHRWMVGDILLKADRMSMAHSLELRVPFLDVKVFEVASKIPAKLRIANGTTKAALRLAAARHIPQKDTARPKLGFPVPVRVWLRQDAYYNKVKEAFTGATAERFFNTAMLVRFLDEHYQGKKDNSRKIWTVYMFLVWYGMYFEN